MIRCCPQTQLCGVALIEYQYKIRFGIIFQFPIIPNFPQKVNRMFHFFPYKIGLSRPWTKRAEKKPDKPLVKGEKRRYSLTEKNSNDLHRQTEKKETRP